jgi:hypothetical protein
MAEVIERVPAWRRGLVLLAALACAIAAGSGCGGDSKPTLGSETHFLTLCEDDGCDAGSECLCGVCTKVCGADAECSSFGASATCAPLAPRVAEGRCPADDSPAAMCDLGCLETPDCAHLGSSFRCEQGYCRPREEAPEPEPMTCAMQPIARPELVVLGDSLIELSTFATDLETAATAAGVLAPSDNLRSYAAAGLSWLADNSLSIHRQYDTARTEGTARLVVMDGGATDMLSVPCGSAPTTDCMAMQNAAAGAELLLSSLASDGVEHVVYFFYGDPPPTSDLIAVKPGLDVLRPLAENACGKSALACHFLDLRPLFADHPEYFAQDGINLTAAGAQAIADAVVTVMVDRCVAAP